ncbi:Transcriptional regulator, contains XRE-family HTH domain [Nonomuraea maritima]|uniref:Transcriptional regulator, contains XRE-family HTH domain n=1 Tax=Nonomuraea maritima TaxID=683260 RepID=A0A1G9R679_9ACTN|nr:helix-turn-helix transcriptional regulator [Nonomuraea maritima]SDM18620.1 Transcriptional regulator, contains XRE-family HTH domain [Nonomuraea maritima]
MATHHAAHTGASGAAKPAPKPGPQQQPHEDLDPRAELSDFLRTRRDRLKLADVGLTDYSRRRRVPGLRREELAQLAGVSAAYYTRFEQGNARNVSREVVDAISRVLRLSDAEHAHLLRLAQPKRRPEKHLVPPRQQVRPEVRELLTAMEGVPAYVWGRRSDVLAWNQTASAVFGDWTARAPQDRNWARITFFDPASRKLFTDWDTKAQDVVGQLRLWGGLHPDDTQLASLIGELSMKSEAFRKLWAAHDVKKKTHGTIRLTHPLVGHLTLRYETLALPGDQDQFMSTYHAEPGSPSEESLRLLASWGADVVQDRSADTSH